MAYVIYDTLELAATRSRDAWTAILGRAKRARDVTEYLNSWFVGRDGRTALVMTGITLRGGEAPTDTLDEQNWPRNL